jgi:hypothetical protein
MIEGNARTTAEADAGWRTATEVLFPSTAAPTPPLPAWRQAQQTDLILPPLPPSPWPAPPWGSTPAAEPSCEPDSYLTHRNGRRTVMIRALDPSNLLKHELAPGLRPPPTKDYDSDDLLASYASTKTRCQPRLPFCTTLPMRALFVGRQLPTLSVRCVIPWTPISLPPDPSS